MIVGAMPDLQQEQLDLDRADLHIAQGERRVAEQILLIERMGRKGHDTAEAEKLLRNFEQTLENWRDHRRLILDALERGEAT
jgi:hypothetical protein